MRLGLGHGITARAALQRAGVSLTPVQQLVQDLGGDDAVIGVYWTKSGVRVGSTGTRINLWEDARGADTLSAVHLPSVVGERVALGDVTPFNNAQKVTVVMWFTWLGSNSAYRALLTRTNLGADLNFVLCAGSFNTANDRPVVFMGAASATMATILTIGKTYKLTLVYDGAGAANADRAKFYLSTFNALTQTWSADAAESMSYSGTVPANLSTVTRNTFIGGADHGTQGYAGFINHETRVWFGTALSLAQVQAETLVANPVAAQLRYTFDGGVGTNTGTLAGSYDGTLSTDAKPCSGDLRYGPPFTMSHEGSNPLAIAPTWDPVNLEIEFNGSTHVLFAGGRTTGGQERLSLLNANSRVIAVVGTMPTVNGTQQEILELRSTNYEMAAYMVSGAPQEVRLLGYAGGVALASTYGPPPVGVRAMHNEQQAGPGGKHGLAFGADARQQSVGTGTANNVQGLSLAYHISSGQFGNPIYRALLIYKGADWFTGGTKQGIFNAFAAAELGATI